MDATVMNRPTGNFGTSPHALRSLWRWLLVMAVAVAISSGCAKRTESPPASAEEASDQTETLTADAVLQKLIRAYQEADQYGDQGLLHLSYELDGQSHRDTGVMAVQLSRPNRARVQVYQADIACDGQHLMARITDESTNNIDDQWLVRAAPANLSLDSLLCDTLLANVVTSGLGRLPIQLELLLSEAPLQGFFEGNVQRKLLDDRDLHGAACFRVSVKTREGEFVLWIDRASYLLRRFEYPPALLAANVPPEQQPQRVQLVAEFSDAAFEVRADGSRTFSLNIPDNDTARRVRYFVKPPQPLSSNLLGQRTSDFQFVNLDGSTWSSAQLADKIAILHWYVDHPSCQASLEQWEAIRQKYKDREDLVFVAVCVEPSTISNEVVREVLRRWGIEAPVVRDLNAAGRDVFGIAALPAIVVLDRQQTVQAFEITYNPDLSQQLPIALDQLIEGQDLASQVLAQFHNDTAEYYQTLAAAGASANMTPPSAQTVPVQWRLTKLWQAPFHEPGNMLLVSRPDQPVRLYALEEGRIILELDQNGRSLGTHILNIPESETMTHLRASSDGQSFVAFSMGGRHAYWFDAEWQLLRAVPGPLVAHDGIRDAELIGTDDQLRLCLATTGGGIIAIGRSGKVEWQLNQPQVQSLCVHLPSGQLIAADASGRVFGVSADGREQPVADKHGHGLFQAWSVSCPPGEGGAALMGLSYLPDSARVMYGLDERFQGLWEYQLPGDPFRFPTEFVASGEFDVGGAAHWVFASADGAIHLLSADGRQHDYFFTGDHISGLQVWQMDTGSALIVGSENAITAWKLEPLNTSPIGTEPESDRVAPAGTIRSPILNASRPDER